jgi:hypothetical protein
MGFAAAIALVVALIWVGVLLAPDSWLPGRSPVESRPFVAAEWKDDPSSRLAMSADLQDHHLALGMTRGQVRALLGTPDWEDERTMSFDLRVPALGGEVVVEFDEKAGLVASHLASK